MTIGKINILKAVEDAEAVLKNNPALSGDVKAMMNLLLLVIKLLVDKMGLNSQNSSIPPSKDPLRKKGLREKSGKKPGGQEGHVGSTLGKEANPDIIKVIPVDQSKLPPGNYKVVGYETRQVVDIKISRVVTEFRAEIVSDEKGNKYIASFPSEVTRPIQYGASVKAQATYFLMGQLIPYERTAECFRNQYGINISQGTLVNILKEAYDLLEGFEKSVKDILILEALLHADETGVNISGKNFWLHTASNEKWTLFHVNQKRGLEGMKAGGGAQSF